MATAQWSTYVGEFTGDGADLPYDTPDPLLLDSLTSNSAYQAYSLRRLSLDYEGYAVKVRRSSDSTTLDVGFDDDGLLDTAALSAFVSTGSGYVDTWYDQSGNSRDMVQATTTKQPRIVDTGTLVTIGDAPGVEFLGSDCHLKHDDPGTHTLIAAGGVSCVEVHTDTAATASISYGETAPPSGGRVIPFSWTAATPAAFIPSIYNDAGSLQSSNRPTFTTTASGEVHQDIFVKPLAAGAVLHRDGVQRSSSAYDPTMPTTLTSATMGGYEAATSGQVTGDYIGKVGEHIILAGAVGSPAIMALIGSHEAYFGI